MADSGTGHILLISGISVRTGDSRPERGIGDALARAVSAVDVSVLSKNMESFLAQLRTILSPGAANVGGFEIAQVEVSAQITADGQVCLLGSGAKVEVQGWVKFVLRRVTMT
jgi:hypothetical protein